jgi:hypothetical protein
MVRHPRLNELVTALGIAEVVSLADYATEDETWVPTLLEACKHSKPRNRKAAWVLHHIFLRHPRFIEPKVEQIISALDASEDGSVHRELLKVLVEVNLNEAEWMKFSSMLFDLGEGILFDEDQTKGMHYIAMRLVERFVKSEKDRLEAVTAIRQMLSDSDTGEQPICHAAEGTIQRIEKRIIPAPKV